MRSRGFTFEIGMLGQNGLYINDPRESHVLRALLDSVLLRSGVHQFHVS